MAGLAVERLQPASLGLDIAASPEYIDQRRGQVLDNMLPGRDGKVTMRGELSFPTPAPIYPDDGLRHGAFAFTPTAGPLDDFLIRGATNTKVRRVGSPDVAVADATFLPGRSCARHGANVYGINPYPGDITNGCLLKWDGGTSAVKQLGSAPRGALAVCSHLRAMFVLGGSVPGTTTPFLGNALYWTDPNTTTIDLTTMATWQDDVSGLVNQVTLDGDPSDPGVALASVANRLYILRERSLWVMTGSSPSSFTFRQISRNGCLDPAAVQVIDDVLYFMSPEGLMRYDGAALENLSRRIWPAMANEASGFQAGWSLARLGSEYLMLAGPQGAPYFAALLYLPSGAWSKLTVSTAADPDTFGHVALVGGGNKGSFAWIGQKFWVAHRVAVPEANFHFGMDDSLYPFPAAYRTRVARLGTPANMAQLNRVFVDYRFDGNDAQTPWEVHLYDGEGTMIQNLGTVPLASSSGNVRHRTVFECFREVSEISVELVWSSGTAPDHNAEIYDVWIEYQPARQR